MVDITRSLKQGYQGLHKKQLKPYKIPPFYHSEIKLKVAEMQKQKLEIEEEMNRENKKKLEEAMDKAEEEYYKALNDIPGAWGLIGMQVTMATTHLLVN